MRILKRQIIWQTKLSRFNKWVLEQTIEIWWPSFRMGDDGEKKRTMFAFLGNKKRRKLSPTSMANIWKFKSYYYKNSWVSYNIEEPETLFLLLCVIWFGSCYFADVDVLFAVQHGIHFAIFFAVMIRDWENRQQISYYNRMMNPKKVHT